MADYVKLHTEALDSVKIQTLPANLVLPWLNLLIVSRLHGGALPALSVIAFRLRTSEATVATWIAGLQSAGLIDPPGKQGELTMHDWEFWNPQDGRDQQNAERQRRFRARKKAERVSEENTKKEKLMQSNVTFVTRNVTRNVTDEPLRNAATDWPLAAAAIHGFFPDTDGPYIQHLGELAIQQLISVGLSPEGFTDELFARAVATCHKGKKQYSAALFEKTIPQCAVSWLTPKPPRRLSSREYIP